MVAASSALTLHSSWRMVAGGYAGPAVLLLLAALAWTRDGSNVVPLAIAGIGAVLLAVLLFDVPVATRFDQAGVERRSPLRRHRIAWDDVRQLTRARGKLLSVNRFTGDEELRANRGGLVAVVGRRRYLLVDTAESQEEFEGLMALLDEMAPALVDADLMPPPDLPPSFMYRRRRWRPDDGTDR